MTTTVRFHFPASADRVWSVLSDFGGMAHWSPDLAMSTQIARHGIKPGAVRELTFVEPVGGIRTIHERILSCGDRWFTYVIDGGFGPYAEAGSTWKVHRDGDGSIVEVTSYLVGGNWRARVLRPLSYWHLRRGLKRAMHCLATKLS